VLVATDHRAIDWGLVLSHAPLVVDTRGVARRHPGAAARVITA
jgi:UDP-N-acetyl-D-mannosaminuronate dehydrogenase